MKNNPGFKRFWPLILTVGLWLAVVFTPALNLLFRAQVGGSSMIPISVWPSTSNVPDFWEKSARRFPNEATVLQQAAGEYPASEWSEIEAEHSDEDDVTAIDAPGSPPGSGSLPSGPTFQPSQVFSGQLKRDPQAEKLRRLDLLIVRFPDNADLIASRLRETTSWMKNGRVGGELSDPDIQKNAATGKPSPEKSEGNPNYSSADLNAAIALAQKGGKMEPDNAFFNWMQCYFLMYAWRDEEAFRALDAAAGKTRFDDHLLNEQKAQMTALSMTFGRPLMIEEKLQELFTGAPLPHLARYREMARILSWQAVKAARRGDHRESLRITVGLARTAARMREN